LQCGQHGYSARDCGFRFDIDVGSEEREKERLREGVKEGLKEGVKEGVKEEVKEGVKEEMKNGVMIDDSERHGVVPLTNSHGVGPPIHPHAGDPLLVEDPVNVMNNVTKNCYKAPVVQKVFFEVRTLTLTLTLLLLSLPLPLLT
jgi:hypothetical protein